MDKKKFVAEHRRLISVLCRVHNLGSFLRVKNKGKGNCIDAPCSLMKKTSIQFYGNHNVVKIGDFCQLTGVSIVVHGNNNTITLGSWGTFHETCFSLENDENSVIVGNHAHFYGAAELAATEGTCISVGEDCLCSTNIQIRTGDSHSVLDLTGHRTNASESISLGNHVWLGRNVTILKGSKIGNHCLVGTGALVTKDFSEPNCALGGVPARILKKEVDWSVHHIPVGEKAPDFIPPNQYADV